MVLGSHRVRVAIVRVLACSGASQLIRGVRRLLEMERGHVRGLVVTVVALAVALVPLRGQASAAYFGLRPRWWPGSWLLWRPCSGTTGT